MKREFNQMAGLLAGIGLVVAAQPIYTYTTQGHAPAVEGLVVHQPEEATVEEYAEYIEAVEELHAHQYLQMKGPRIVEDAAKHGLKIRFAGYSISEGILEASMRGVYRHLHFVDTEGNRYLCASHYDSFGHLKPTWKYPEYVVPLMH